MSRICKKCLIGQQAEEYLRMIRQGRELVSPRDRTPDDQYEQRIALCEACEYLNGATCRACGCYVELRAARRSVHCPYKKW